MNPGQLGWAPKARSIQALTPRPISQYSRCLRKMHRGRFHETHYAPEV